MYAKTIEDLVIYQISLQLSTEIAGLVKVIPNNWRIKETDQILRSSSSVHSNITEGFSQRFYIKKFLHYLNIALGSSDETQNHIKKLRNDSHIKMDVANYYLNRYKNLSVKILNFINYLRKNSVHDSPHKA